MGKNLQKLFMLILIAGIATFSSCYPDDDITNAESDIIVTAKDDTVDFSKISTYYLPEKVFIADSNDQDEPVEYESVILNQIVKNMNEYGYTRVTDTTDAENNIDVVLIASTYKKSVTSISYPYYPYYPGWDWWWGSPGWGYYPPGWGYYPPGGYYPPYVSSFTMGTVKIDMIDPWNPQEIAPDTTIYPNYWQAAIQGLLQGRDIEKRIKNSINQAFKQSDYLKH